MCRRTLVPVYSGNITLRSLSLPASRTGGRTKTQALRSNREWQQLPHRGNPLIACDMTSYLEPVYG
jgi:hypothetical protein